MSSSDTIGTYLREKRKGAGVALEEVSGATGISTGILKAIEDDDRKQLPAEVYIRAFQKKYAVYLGLDPEDMFSSYQQPGSQARSGGRFSFRTVVTLKGQEENLYTEVVRKLFVPAIVILGGFLLYWLYTNYLGSHDLLGFLD